jgi:hypothetical protein
VEELGDGRARLHNASDGTDGWVTAGASRRHRFAGLSLTIYRPPSAHHGQLTAWPPPVPRAAATLGPHDLRVP